MRVKVLMVDDEDQRDLIANAEEAGIDIVLKHPPKENWAGLLEQDPWRFDAVILDVMEERNTGSGGKAHVNKLTEGYNQVTKIGASHSRLIPICVYTGHGERAREYLGDDSDKVPIVEKGYGGESELFKVIKDLVRSRLEHVVKQRYKEELAACAFVRVKRDQTNDLLEILKSVHGDFPTGLQDDKYFNSLRKILEQMFRAAHGLRLVHDKCINDGKVIIAACSLFLAGKEFKELRIKCKKAHAPPLVEGHIRHIIDVTNVGSHDEDKEKNRLQLGEFRETVRSPYLLYSLTFQLLDVLLWFKAYAEANGDAEENKRLWVDMGASPDASDTVMGTVTNIHADGFAFMERDEGGDNAYIMKALVSRHGLTKGVRIKAVVEMKEKGLAVQRLDVLPSRHGAA